MPLYSPPVERAALRRGDLEDSRPLIRAHVESYSIYSSQDIPIPIFVFEYVSTLFITCKFFIINGEGEKKF